MKTTESLQHHGVLGMKWGVRKERKAAERAERKDLKWVRKQGSKVTAKTQKSVMKEMAEYERTMTGGPRLKSGKLSKTYVNQYNQKLAQLMNERVGNVPAPSGRVIRYVAKRGSVGVHTALADQNYNMNLLGRGVYESGRVAYKKEVLDKG